jgi:hypothetical protein
MGGLIFCLVKGLAGGVAGGPSVQIGLVGPDELLLYELALFDGEATALLAIIDNPGGREVLMIQAGPEAQSGSGIGVVDFRPINSLEGFHRADRADEFEAGVIARQIAGEIEGHRGYAPSRHEIARIQAHLGKICVGGGKRALPIFDTQNRMAVACTMIDLAARYAQTDDRRLLEIVRVCTRVQEMPEQVTMQIAKAVRCLEPCSSLVVLCQQHAEVVIAHVGREVVPDDAVDARIAFPIDDTRLQYLDHREGIGATSGGNMHLD